MLDAVGDVNSIFSLQHPSPALIKPNLSYIYLDVEKIENFLRVDSLHPRKFNFLIIDNCHIEVNKVKDIKQFITTCT